MIYYHALKKITNVSITGMRGQNGSLNHNGTCRGWYHMVGSGAYSRCMYTHSEFMMGE